MADREWRRDPDDYRERKEFLDERDYDLRRYNDRYEPPYVDRSYDNRDYDDRRYHEHGEHHGHGPGVADRVREWWHRNVSDPDEERRYDRDYSHGPISAGHSGWVRDRDWEN